MAKSIPEILLPVIRTAYADPYIDEGFKCRSLDPDTGLYKDDVSLADQSQRDDCDINEIVEKHKRAGVLDDLLNRGSIEPKMFDDVSDRPTFQEALHIVANANDMFMALPAKVRREFDNDPAQFLAAYHDPAQADRLRALGVLPSLPDVAPVTSKDESGEG